MIFELSNCFISLAPCLIFICAVLLESAEWVVLNSLIIIECLLRIVAWETEYFADIATNKSASAWHAVYTLQPVVQPVVQRVVNCKHHIWIKHVEVKQLVPQPFGWTMQMSTAKRRLWRHRVDARSKAAGCVDSRRCGAFDRILFIYSFLPSVTYYPEAWQN